LSAFLIEQNELVPEGLLIQPPLHTLRLYAAVGSHLLGIIERSHYGWLQARSRGHHRLTLRQYSS